MAKDKKNKPKLKVVHNAVNDAKKAVAAENRKIRLRQKKQQKGDE